MTDVLTLTSATDTQLSIRTAKLPGLDQCFDVASRWLGTSERAYSANPILMLIDHLRDLVPAHPEPLIDHTASFLAGSISACFTLLLFPDSRR
jgi:hypothetical protein